MYERPMEEGQTYKKVKVKIYKALVLSIRLYNSECWEISPGMQARLEELHTRTLKKVLKVGGDRRDRQNILAAAGVNEVCKTIAHRRIKFVSRALTFPDAMTDQMLEQEEDRDTKWWKQFEDSLQQCEVSLEEFWDKHEPIRIADTEQENPSVNSEDRVMVNNEDVVSSVNSDRGEIGQDSEGALPGPPENFFAPGPRTA